MARRNKQPSRLEVRVSHEAARRSKAWLAAAFESVVPIVERQPSRCGVVGAAMPQYPKSTMRR
jgi:hypothetical protein